MQVVELKDYAKINKTEIAFVICEHTSINSELLNNIVNNNKEIYLYGKWCTALEMDISKLTDECNVCCCTLATFIDLLTKCNKDTCVLFYDDEDLKKYITKRIEEINLKEESINRIELCCHSNMSKEKGISPIEDLIDEVKSNNIDGIAITDTMTTQAYKSAQIALEKNDSYLKLIYGCELEYENNQKVHVLCRNNDSKRKLYEILTAFYTNDNNDKYKDLKETVEKHRELFVVGSDSLSTNIINYALLNDEEKLNKEIVNYDYIEVAPIKMYKLITSVTDNEIKDAIILIIKQAAKLKVLVVATNNVHYASKKQLLAHKILETKDMNRDELEERCPDYFAINQDLISTEEMRYAFDWLNDDELVKDIVINNTHKIANLCEDFKPFDKSRHLPNIENAYEIIEKHAYAALRTKYGNDVDSLIVDRLKEELILIKENNYASIYFIASGLCKLSELEAGPNGVRGSIGTTLVGYLLGITECNPLPPHYVCPNCHKVIWDFSYEDGFDMPNRTCECGYEMIQDGHNLHYQVFMGANGERMPDIDLNFDPDFCENIPEYLKEVIGQNKIIYVGNNWTINPQEAKKIVDDYAGEDEGLIDIHTKRALVNELCNVSSKHKVKKDAYIIVPDDSINDYTPLMKIDDMLCTQNDYHDISNYFYKQDCLEHIDMYIYNVLGMNGIYVEEIDINDQEIYELFKGNKDYGLAGIKEFNNDWIIDLIKQIKPSKFSELVKISSLAHGTNVWKNNQDKLFAEGLPLSNIIASRDDVMDVLLEHGVEMKDAYEVMENVRKGKSINDKQLAILKAHEVSDEFINVCKSIRYMYPKAHCIAYLINTLRFAWLKIHKPLYFYGQWFAYRSKLDVVNKTVKEIEEIINNLSDEEELIIIKEMKARGINFIDSGLSDGTKKIEFELNHNNEDEIIFFTSNAE